VPRLTRILYSLALVFALALPGTTRAQDAAPKVKITLESANQVLADLKLLSDLTTKTEQKQWNNIEAIIDTFLFGIDKTKPIGVTVTFNGAEEEIGFALPVSNFKEFVRNNLGGFDINTRKIAPGLYRLSEKKKTLAYMRYQKRYVTINNKRALVNAVYVAKKATAALLAKKHSLAATIRNKAGGEAARRKSFGLIRKNLIAAVKARKNESAEELALRREVLGFQLGEAERFVAESESLDLGFRVDPKTKQATLDIDLAAIPDSELDKSIRGLAVTPSHFANVPRDKASILAFRVHHPLDKFRRASLQLVLAATHKATQAEISRTPSVTDAQKAASTKALNSLVAVVQTTLAKGLLDGFVQVRPAQGGANVLVAGIRTDQGQQIRNALKAIPQSTVPTDVDLNSEEISGISIHVVTVPAKLKGDFAAIFGDEKTMLVGTSDNAAWCAAGPGALKALKDAITAQAKKPAPAKASPLVVDLSIKAGPWITALHRRMGTEGEVEDRKLAIKAFALGQDTVTLQLRREGNRVVGHTTLGTGILRFLGKKMAQFSKDNFE
jgi:hypothetical protein